MLAGRNPQSSGSGSGGVSHLLSSTRSSSNRGRFNSLPSSLPGVSELEAKQSGFSGFSSSTVDTVSPRCSRGATGLAAEHWQTSSANFVKTTIAAMLSARRAIASHLSRVGNRTVPFRAPWPPRSRTEAPAELAQATGAKAKREDAYPDLPPLGTFHDSTRATGIIGIIETASKELGG